MKRGKIALAIAAMICMPMLFGSGGTNVNEQNIKLSPALTISPLANNAKRVVYSPAQIKRAYGFDKINATGQNQKIGIVIAYGSPTIQKDLEAFNVRFGIERANLKIFYPQGKPTIIDEGWAQETSLDVQWAHALAPKAEINLIVAKTASFNDLLGAVDYAAKLGVQVVSMSWGGDEFQGESNWNSYFQRPNTVYIAASGDSGAGTSWPAVSSNVLAVGGTTLNLDGAGNLSGSEIGWSGSGGGISKYEKAPSYQQKLNITTNSRRVMPDVSFLADPNTGVYVNYNSNWYAIGGTSFSAPAWAAFIALVNQNRAVPLSNIQSKLYSIASGNQYLIQFRDIKSGQNGSSSMYYAKNGYDLVTGLGSPITNNLYNILVKP